jgi:hypothetical protein
MSPFNHHRKLQDLGMKDRADARSFANFPVGYGDATLPLVTQLDLSSQHVPTSFPGQGNYPEL